MDEKKPVKFDAHNIIHHQERRTALFKAFDKYLDSCSEYWVKEIDCLTAELKAKDTALTKIIVESGKVDISNWPQQQQICQSIAEQALKGESE